MRCLRLLDLRGVATPNVAQKFIDHKSNKLVKIWFAVEMEIEKEKEIPIPAGHRTRPQRPKAQILLEFDS